MKKTVGVVAVLAVVVVGAYYGMGVVTERSLKRGLDNINQSNGLHAEVKDYHRGWFCSTAALTWTIHVPPHVVKSATGESTSVPAKDYTLDMPLKIYHGPVMLTNSGLRFGLGYAHSQLTLPEAYKAEFAERFTANSIPPVLNLNVFVSYLDTTMIETNVNSFSLTSKNDQGSFEWMGMKSDMSISPMMDKISAQIVLNGMLFTKDSTRVLLGKMTSDSNFHKAYQGLFLGDANFSMTSLLAENEGKRVFQLDSLDVASTSDVNNDLFDFSLSISANQIFANDKNYGPAKLALSFKNFDAAALAEINQQANNMRQGSDAERQQALMAMLPQVPKLFAKGPIVEISELSLVTPEGSINGHLSLSLPVASADNPFQLIQKLQGQGKLTFPVTVFQNLMEISAKQKLQQKALETPATQTSQSGDTTAVAATPATSEAAAPTTETQATTPASDGTSTGTNPAVSVNEQPVATQAPIDLDQEAKNAATAQTAALVQSGLLSQQGDNYVIEVSLSQGQLSINGQPFNPAMVKF